MSRALRTAPGAWPFGASRTGVSVSLYRADPLRRAPRVCGTRSLCASSAPSTISARFTVIKGMPLLARSSRWLTIALYSGTVLVYDIGPDHDGGIMMLRPANKRG
jgi:hypothetical protein